MGPTDSMMVVLTHPEDPARDDEYNFWYSGNHLSDVLLIPGFESASRFKQAISVQGTAPQYAALYQVDSKDVVATQEVLMKHFATENEFREPMPLATNNSLPASEGLISVDSWGYYEKISDTGTAIPSGDDGPKAIMTVWTHPHDPSKIDEFNHWYDSNHVIDVIKAPHFRSATRYKQAMQIRGEMPAPYLCVYELDSADIDDVHTGLMKWLSTPDDFRLPMPQLDEENGLVQIDFWGYYTTVAQGHKAPLEELLAAQSS